MGVNGLLPHLLTAGRLVDLGSFRAGVLVGERLSGRVCNVHRRETNRRSSSSSTSSSTSPSSFAFDTTAVPANVVDEDNGVGVGVEDGSVIVIDDDSRGIDSTDNVGADATTVAVAAAAAANNEGIGASHERRGGCSAASEEVDAGDGGTRGLRIGGGKGFKRRRRRRQDAAPFESTDGRTRRKRGRQGRHQKQRRRPVRIAVDASGWIARACHGIGAALLDERGMTNYGRAELRMMAAAGRAGVAIAGDSHGDGDGDGNGVGDGNGDGDGGTERGRDRNCEEVKGREGAQPAEPAHHPAGTVEGDGSDDENDRAALRERRATAAYAAADAERLYRNNLRADYALRCASSVLDRVLSLRSAAGADVLVVLDGATPPAKSRTCRIRRERREANVALAAEGEEEAEEEKEQEGVSRWRRAEAERAEKEATSKGKDSPDDETKEEAGGGEEDDTDRRIRAARRAGAQSSELHSLVVRAFVLLLRKERVPFLVAPYEADAQLAHVARQGLVDLVVTDDSDLVAYGLPAVMYKLEVRSKGGRVGVGGAATSVSGVLIRRCDLGCTPAVLSLLDFSDVMLATTFVAAGCDYCESLRGIGIVKARNAVKRAFHGAEAYCDKRLEESNCLTADKTLLERVFDQLFSNCYRETPSDSKRKEYEQNFLKGLLMYRHPVVFDPLTGHCVFLRDPWKDPDPELISYKPYAELCSDKAKIKAVVGSFYGNATAVAIAEGWMDPKAIGQLYSETETPAEVMRALEKERGGSAADGETVSLAPKTARETSSSVGAFPVLEARGLPLPNGLAANDVTLVADSQLSPICPSQQTQGSHGTVGSASTSQTRGTCSTSPSRPSTQLSSQSSHRSCLSADVLSPDLLHPPPESPLHSLSCGEDANSTAGANGNLPLSDRIGGMKEVVERLLSRNGGGTAESSRIDGSGA